MYNWPALTTSDTVGNSAVVERLIWVLTVRVTQPPCPSAVDMGKVSIRCPHVWYSRAIVISAGSSCGHLLPCE